MDARKKNSVEKVIELSVSERILAVEAIWDSIVEEPESVPITNAQKDELDHRLITKPKKVDLADWQQVKGRIQKIKK